jgi:hypothetical protein
MAYSVRENYGSEGLGFAFLIPLLLAALPYAVKGITGLLAKKVPTLTDENKALIARLPEPYLSSAVSELQLAKDPNAEAQTVFIKYANQYKNDHPVSTTGAEAAGAPTEKTNWPVIGGAAAGVLVVGALLVTIVRRRR